MFERNPAEEIQPRSAVSEARSYPEGVRALPTLPSVLFRFLGLIADDTTTTEQLANFICQDPALLTRVIPFVNDSSRGRRLPPSLWKQAIAALGKERIRNLAFTTPLLRSFEPLPVGFNAMSYWERSFLCAQACQKLARQLGLPETGQYYVAGLLHDLGYLLFLQKNPAGLQRVFERLAAAPGDTLEIEAEMMGVDHCQLGSEMAAQLNLDPWLRRALRDHHMPSRDSDTITLVTCIGSAFCHYKGVDFFPTRALVGPERERRMKELLRELLPSLPVNGPALLLAAMEQAMQELRAWISEITMDSNGSGEGSYLLARVAKGSTAAASLIVA